MPLYEFDCDECGRFEVRQHFGDEHVAKCPKCGAENTKRVYSMFRMSVMTDSEIQQRLMGVPKKRIEKAKELRSDRAKRQSDPSCHSLI